MAVKSIFGNSSFAASSGQPRNYNVNTGALSNGLFAQSAPKPQPTTSPATAPVSSTGFQRSSVYGPADVTQAAWPLLESTYNDANAFNRDAAMRRGALERYRMATDPSLAGSRYNRNAAILASQGNRAGMGQAARLGNMGYGRAAQDAAVFGAQNNATELANQAYLSEFDPATRAKNAQLNLAAYGPEASMQSLGAYAQLMNILNQTQQVANSKPKESGGLFGDLLSVAGSVAPLFR